VASAGVNDSKLLSVLDDVKKYWRDLLRPSLTSFSCEAVGGKLEEADDVSLMLTLGSSGFGIHDDIIDKSSSKHLRMTIIGLHGIDSALLAGDLLIMKAWTTIHQLIRTNYKPKKIADIIEAYGSSSIEICEAELMETLCRKKLETNLDYYMNILWKAMAEIEACSKIGAIIGGGKKYEVQALAEFGRRLGFIYRLGDDMEDCLNLKGDLVHRIKFESVPLPLLFAAKTSSENYFEIKLILKKSQISPSDAKRLLGFCFETEAFEYVRKIAEKNRDEGIKKLCKLKPSSALDVLIAIIESSYIRVAELCR
jgi:geranylgeranyl pyrophosphate synthase